MTGIMTAPQVMVEAVPLRLPTRWAPPPNSDLPFRKYNVRKRVYRGAVAEFIGEDLTGSRFQRVDLAGSRFQLVTLSGVEFRGCELVDTRFRIVEMTGVVMRGVELRDVEISGDIGNLTING